MQAFMDNQQFPVATPTKTFYVNAMKCLDEAKLPFLVGGAYAFSQYSGIERPHHDFDIFVRKEDADEILKTLSNKLGCMGHKIFPHWLYKAFYGQDFIDIIFSSGNGLSTVDDEWFDRAKDAIVFDYPARIIPAEEMIWSKAFVMERERYDGADVAHTIRRYGQNMDWKILIQRFGSHWRVLYSHIILAGYIYPSDMDVVPMWVMETLTAKLLEEHKQGLNASSSSPSPSPSPSPSSSSLSSSSKETDSTTITNAQGSKVVTEVTTTTRKLCHGTFLSRQQYLKDLCEWEYDDGRVVAKAMTEQDVINWTAAALHPGSGAGKS